MRRINWMNVGLLLMIATIITIIALTPSMHRYANEYRQLFGISSGYGGEFIVWIFPLAYLPIYLRKREKYNGK